MVELKRYTDVYKIECHVIYFFTSLFLGWLVGRFVISINALHNWLKKGILNPLPIFCSIRQLFPLSPQNQIPLFDHLFLVSCLILKLLWPSLQYFWLVSLISPWNCMIFCFFVFIAWFWTILSSTAWMIPQHTLQILAQFA